VDADERQPKCSCPDHETPQVRCKHIIAVEYTVSWEIRDNKGATVTEILKVTYAQNWTALQRGSDERENLRRVATA
jgi:uncharacterized Zn finger protein